MSETSSPALESTSDAGAEQTVDLRLPADGAYAAVLRTLAAGLAARLDFTMDDIEDLRMVVSEAVGLVLDQAEGGDLVCSFALTPGRLSLSVTATASEPEADYENFGWQVLAVLAADAGIEIDVDRLTVRATVLSSVADDGTTSPAGS